MFLPLVVALDFGGVLYWTQYVAAIAIFLAFALAIPSLFGRDNSRGLKQHLLLLPMAVWIGYTFFQGLPLPGFLVGMFSPASQTAYTDWIQPFVPADQMPGLYPITVDQYRTTHALAMLCVLAVVLWTSSIVFSTRIRLMALLSALAASGALIAAVGIGRRLIPGFEMWSFTDNPAVGFASFINRNNAALFLNLGLGCGLGLLAWRISALTGQDFDDPEFDYSDTFSLISDRTSLIGILAVVFCGVGLVIGGSRGGVVAAVVGLILAFGWVRQKRGFSTLLVVGASLAIGIAVLTIPTDLSLESITRLDFQTQDNQSTILRNGRLEHWPDGLRTAMAHFPAGSGLGSYGHAYLPHQETTSGGWFQHADNLWLELFTEQGVLGILLALSAFALAIYALHHLTDSADAIDHGVRIAGWYCLGAILISQIFDFGLILPANALMVAILFAAVTNRSSQQFNLPAGDEDEQHKRSPAAPVKKVLFERKRTVAASLAIPCLLPIPILWSMATLSGYASDQRLAREAEAEYEVARLNPTRLTETSDRLANRLTDSGNPELLSIAARYQILLARFREVEAAQPVNARQQSQFFAMTSPARRGGDQPDVRRRPGWLSREKSLDFYTPILDEAAAQLLRSPYNRSARWEFAHLDFAHKDDEKAKTALDQLVRFNHADPIRLIQLGREAIESDAPEIATRAFRRTIDLRWQYARTVFPDIIASDDLSVESILPDDPSAYQVIADLVARETLKEGNAFKIDGTLAIVRERLGCETCDGTQARIRCLQNSIELAWAAGDYIDAFESYDEIIRLDASNANIRYAYARRLLQRKRYSEARRVCQTARDAFPDDATRFDRLIDEISQAELSNE